MTVKELITILNRLPKHKIVVISNVRDTPFAIHNIKEVLDGEEGPVYIRADRTDR